MKLTVEIVEKMLARISHVYQSQFSIVPRDADGNNPGTIDTWYQLLEDLDPRYVALAVMSYLAEDHEYAPKPAQIRIIAKRIEHKRLNPVPGMVAWDRVVSLSRGEKVTLSDAERKSLNAIGGTWTIKNSKSLSFERSAFLRHYDESQAWEERNHATVPMVALEANLCQSGDAGLMLPNGKQCKARSVNRPSPEHLREMLKGYTGG